MLRVIVVITLLSLSFPANAAEQPTKAKTPIMKERLINAPSKDTSLDKSDRKQIEFTAQLIALQKQNHEIIEKLAPAHQKSFWEIYLPIILQFTAVMTAIVVLYRTQNQNKRNEYLPFLKQLHDELDDCILTIYDLLNNPQWEQWDKETKERVAENHKRLHDNFKGGNKYFVISAIPDDFEAIQRKIKNAGRRKMYFNEVRARYVRVYEAFISASQAYGCRQPLYQYFTLTEYEKIYEAFKKMPNLA